MIFSLSDSELARTDFAFDNIWNSLGGIDQDATFPHFSVDAMYDLVYSTIESDPDRVFVDGEELNFDYTASHDINEKNYAAYAMVNFDTELGSIPVNGNFGLRVVHTEVGAGGFSNDLTKLQLEPGTEEDAFNVIFDNCIPKNWRQDDGETPTDNDTAIQLEG